MCVVEERVKEEKRLNDFGVRTYADKCRLL